MDLERTDLSMQTAKETSVLDLSSSSAFRMRTRRPSRRIDESVEEKSEKRDVAFS